MRPLESGVFCLGIKAMKNCPFWTELGGGKCQPHYGNTLGLCQGHECPIAKYIDKVREDAYAQGLEDGSHREDEP